MPEDELLIYGETGGAHFLNVGSKYEL